MKKVIAVLLAVMMLLALTACGKDETPAASTTPAAPAATETPAAAPAAEAPAATEAPADTSVSASNPVVNINGEFDTAKVQGAILVTSSGQGGDDDTVGLFLNMCNGVQYTSNSSATADDLDSVGTLIVAVGASNKGLGGAGISASDELTRTEELLKAAKEKGITVILSHTGGEGRRGSTSDQFIDAALPYADYMIVVASGDADGKFSNAGVPTTLVNSTKDAIGVYQGLFA